MDLFSVAYHLLMEACRDTEDEAKARQTVKDKFRSMELERETGMPQFPAWVPKPADQMLPGRR